MGWDIGVGTGWDLGIKKENLRAYLVRLPSLSFVVVFVAGMWLWVVVGWGGPTMRKHKKHALMGVFFVFEGWVGVQERAKHEKHVPWTCCHVGGWGGAKNTSSMKGTPMGRTFHARGVGMVTLSEKWKVYEVCQKSLAVSKQSLTVSEQSMMVSEQSTRS